MDHMLEREATGTERGAPSVIYCSQRRVLVAHGPTPESPKCCGGRTRIDSCGGRVLACQTQLQDDSPAMLAGAFCLFAV